MPNSLRPTAPRSGTPSATSLSISGMADAAVLEGGHQGQVLQSSGQCSRRREARGVLDGGNRDGE